MSGTTYINHTARTLSPQSACLQVLGNYVVLNSGITSREGHDHNNSLQNPHLPDWAIIDVTVAPSRLAPGGVKAADFFDEAWQLKLK